MNVVDRVFAAVGVLALAAFLTVIVRRVPLWPLIVIFTIGVLFAAYDFWRTLRADSARREARRNAGR